MFRIEVGYPDGYERVHWDGVKDQLYAERVADNAFRYDKDLEWVVVVEQDGTVVHERTRRADGQLRWTNQERGDLWYHMNGYHRDGYRDMPKDGCPACYEAVSI